MEYTIYYNPKCSKCRYALQKLEDDKKEYTIVEYLKEPLSEEELKDLLVKLGMRAEELVRKTEAVYKEEFKGKELSEQEWIDAMVKYPNLIQRPVVKKGNKAVIGRDLENIDKL